MSARRRPAKVMRGVGRDATAGPRARCEETTCRERVMARVPGERRTRSGLRVEVHASDRSVPIRTTAGSKSYRQP